MPEFLENELNFKTGRYSPNNVSNSTFTACSADFIVSTTTGAFNFFIEKLSEKFSNEVGVDLNNQFENQVYGTIMRLIESLENRLIDNETKVDYATHVFAKALDEMVDYLESPRLLN